MATEKDKPNDSYNTPEQWFAVTVVGLVWLVTEAFDFSEWVMGIIVILGIFVIGLFLLSFFAVGLLRLIGDILRGD